jgi:hypothetical protein
VEAGDNIPGLMFSDTALFILCRTAHSENAVRRYALTSVNLKIQTAGSVTTLATFCKSFRCHKPGDEKPPTVSQWRTNPKIQVVVATNIFGSSECNLLHAILLAPRILK